MNINRVVITGNLCFDPELRSLPNTGTSVCTLRVAVNDRVKRGDEWVDRAYYFDVVAWGADADNAAKYLHRGSPIAVDGKLTWREWEKDGEKRQTVEIDTGGRGSIQFLSTGQGGGRRDTGDPGPGADFDTAGVTGGGGGFGAAVAPDDDIPF